MNRAVATIALVVFILSMSSNGFAFERTAKRSLPEGTSWQTGTSCHVQYWNNCVGWTWSWDAWSPHDRIGLNFEACAPTIVSIDISVFDPQPYCPGYGFTAALEVFAADGDGCPSGAALGHTSFLVGYSDPHVAFAQPVDVPTSFVAIVQMGSAGGGYAGYRSDFDAAGATGPQACGTCFPTTRVTHSYYYGTPASPLCPGSKLEGPICDTEWLWTAYMVGAINVEDSSWGKIKNMYR